MHFAFEILKSIQAECIVVANANLTPTYPFEKNDSHEITRNFTTLNVVTTSGCDYQVMALPRGPESRASAPAIIVPALIKKLQ